MSPPSASDVAATDDAARTNLLARLDAVSWKPPGFSFESEGATVRSTFGGQPTGVRFTAWVRAVKDLDAVTLHGRAVSLTVPVRDLVEREAQTPPACLFAWGIANAAGCWLLVDEALRALDASSAGWREKRTVQVELPRTHSTSDDGLLRLHETLSTPLLAAAPDRPGELVASSSVDLGAARRQLLRFHESGETVTLPVTTLEMLGVPAWYVALNGEVDGEGVARLVGARPELRSPVKLEVTTRRGVFTVSPVVLTAERRGLRRSQWSNAKQGALVSLRVYIDHEAPSVQMGATMAPGTHPVSSLLQIARILAALGAGGGSVRVEAMARGDGFPTLSSDVPAAPEGAVPAALLDVLEDLEAIQRATGVSFSLSTERTLPAAELAIIAEVATALRAGRVTHRFARSRVTFSGRDLAGLLAHAGDQQRLRFVLPPSRYAAKVLDHAVSLGARQQVVTGTLALPLDELRALAAEARADEVLDVELLDVEALDVFTEWPKKA